MGCHQPGIGPFDMVAPDTTFPDSLGFVHVQKTQDDTDFSPALHNNFFPARLDDLKQVAVDLEPHRVDLDGDGHVNGADFGQFLSMWDAICDENGVAPKADFNQNCIVDGQDLGTFLSHWNWTAPSMDNEGFTAMADAGMTLAEAEQAVRDAITPKERRFAMDALLDLREEMEWERQAANAGRSVH